MSESSQELARTCGGRIAIFAVTLVLGCTHSADSKAVPTVQLFSVAGELFVSTVSGDVKKGAGHPVLILPTTTEFRTAFWNKFYIAESKRAQLQQIKDEHDRISSALVEKIRTMRSSASSPMDYEAINKLQKQQSDEIDRYVSLRSTIRSEMVVAAGSAIEVLKENSRSIVANGDGKFQIDLSPGEYVLWTPLRELGPQKYAWCMKFRIDNAPQSLIVSQDYAVAEFPTGVVLLKKEGGNNQPPDEAIVWPVAKQYKLY